MSIYLYYNQAFLPSSHPTSHTFPHPSRSTPITSHQVCSANGAQRIIQRTNNHPTIQPVAVSQSVNQSVTPIREYQSARAHDGLPFSSIIIAAASAVRVITTIGSMQQAQARAAGLGMEKFKLKTRKNGGE